MDGIVTWVEIDLTAIAFNVGQFKRHVGSGVEVIAVVKANAYGHGAVQVAQAALQAGATRLAVHRVREAVELRQGGIQAPVLVMGYTPPDGAGLVVENYLTPTLMTLEFATALSRLATASGICVPVHVKVDTGMSRFGLMPEETVKFFHDLQSLPGVYVEGLFTHFATADALDLTFARQQLAVFEQVLESLRQTGFQPPLVHACNSAAAMKMPEAHFNAIRPGIALYGLHPSSEWAPIFTIKPALTLKSILSRVRQLPAGAGVSYGRTYVTQQPILAALVPVGYGDGYHRLLSNKGQVLVRGQRAPIIGRICMDQFVVDVSHIPGVQLGDEVVLIGRQGKESISAEEVAALASTINYEVTTALLPRIERYYK